MSFKNLKKESFKNVQKNYLFLVLICLISAFITSEFVGSLSFASQITNKALENKKLMLHDFIHVNNETKIETKKTQNYHNILNQTVDTFKNTLEDSFSGTIYYKSYSTVKSIEKTENKYMIPLIIISFIAYWLIWLILINPFSVIIRRMFLENRIYKKIPTERFLFLFRTKKTLKTTFTLFVKEIYLFLWSFTIIGYFIKRYSYFLVPYIIAENPNINYKDVLKLSSNLMYGHRIECFKLELSLIGWQILGFLTLGFSNIFFLNIYKTSLFTEYYVLLRKIAKQKNVHNVALLNDTYLYQKADDLLINKKYDDIINYMNEKENYLVNVPKYKKILITYMGISLIDDKVLTKYNEQEYHKIKIKENKDEIIKKSYPTRLFTINDKKKRKIISTRNYLACYPISSLILIFVTCSMIGWLWEVIIRFISDGIFVNKGTMHGPWLPIYGSGVVFILTILYRFRKKPRLLFALTVLLCGFVEYYTGLFLELTHNGQRWWDYSEYFLNLHGRICIEGLLVFGLGGLLAVYLVAPFLNNFFQKIPKKALISLCIVISIVFLGDWIYAFKSPNVGQGITVYENN